MLQIRHVCTSVCNMGLAITIVDGKTSLAFSPHVLLSACLFFARPSNLGRDNVLGWVQNQSVAQANLMVARHAACAVAASVSARDWQGVPGHQGPDLAPGLVGAGATLFQLDADAPQGAAGHLQGQRLSGVLPTLDPKDYFFLVKQVGRRHKAASQLACLALLVARVPTEQLPSTSAEVVGRRALPEVWRGEEIKDA